MMRSVVTGLLAALAVAACAGNPQPGERGYPYNVSGEYVATFEAQGVPYSGTMTLATSRSGAVTGAAEFTSPERVTADVRGTLVADTLSFESEYERAGGCGGVLLGTGRVAAGGAEVAGSMEVLDDCAPDAFSGSFELRRGGGSE